MKLSKSWSWLVLAAMVAMPVTIGAQVESSPAPAPQKPDLSAMAYLEGTWSCTNVSSRRPHPFTTTEKFAMDPDGYWIDLTTTGATVPWFPYPNTGYDKITYDPLAKRWVDLSYGTLGSYGYAVSTPDSTAARIVWHDMTGATGDPSVASNNDVVQTKVSDTQIVSKSTFKEKTGRVVNFTVTCKKQS